MVSAVAKVQKGRGGGGGAMGIKLTRTVILPVVLLKPSLDELR